MIGPAAEFVLDRLQQVVGLVDKSREGREVRFSFKRGPLDDIVKWVEDTGGTWDKRLQRLSKNLK